ncbi:MAG: tol-pal system-associated acyl-CoA thioesterase [Acetobacteraceae bacterium]
MSGHRYPLRVYYEDTDAGGIVYHASYLRFAERARTEALRDLGAPHSELVSRHQRMFVVRRACLDYLRPARLDALLSVLTTRERLGAASLALRQTIEGTEGICAVARIELACVSTLTGQAVRIPPEWRAALAGLQTTP